MGSKDGWEYKHVADFTGGLNISVDPGKLDDKYSPELSNVIFRNGLVKCDTGYVKVGSTVRGRPRLLAQYEKKDGTTEVLLFTNSTAYYWQAAEWQYIQDTAVGTLSNGGEPAGETDLVVDDITGFSDGDYIGIILDNGSEHQTTINGVPAGVTLVMADGVPTGRSVPDNSRVVKAPALSGSDDILPSFCAFPAADWLVFTNGFDNVLRYDGADLREILNLPEAGNTQCRIVRTFENHLLLINTTEGGVRYPQRVRNSDTADGTDWSSGNAGYTDLWESAEHIFTSEHLGPYLIHYKKTSIVRQEYVGSSSLLFHFDTTVTEDGAISAGSVIAKGVVHIVMGNSKFYLYDGGFSIEEFGKEVWDRYFGKSSIMFESSKQRIFALSVDKAEEYWWLIPVNDSATPNMLLRYCKSSGSWSERTFKHPMIYASVYQLIETVLWLECTTAWNSGDWEIPWSDISIATGDVRVLMCGSNPAQVYEYDFLSTTDDGNAITWNIQTKDFLYPDGLLRLNRIDVRLDGSPSLSFSNDLGSTWPVSSDLSASGMSKYRAWYQTVEGRVRMKFSSNQAGIIDWFALQLRKESDW